jgi:hypothetical protein
MSDVTATMATDIAEIVERELRRAYDEGLQKARYDVEIYLRAMILPTEGYGGMRPIGEAAQRVAARVDPNK